MILTLLLCPHGPLLFKGTMQEKHEQHTSFFLFPIYTIASYLHIHITYLLSVRVPPTNFDFWSLTSGWWRYLHHLRRWWRYLHHLRGWINGNNFLLTTTQNKALNQYTLYNSAQFKFNKATGLPLSHSKTC